MDDKFAGNLAWEQRKLGENIKLMGGATPFKGNPEYWNGDIVWLSSQEIKERFVVSGTYKVTEKAVKDNTTKVVSAGTPLIVTRSGILARKFPISIPIIDVTINQDIKALIYDSDKIKTDFLIAELQKNEGYILKSIVKGGTT
ncbi:restriction endonuclease subunit S, partial [Oscillospiraceae bacterium OttesenSCG-928-F05]|nr:restriction endonuclease subunit S [Oscillospiraceae bacterium OttesenSCG-928-F05]